VVRLVGSIVRLTHEVPGDPARVVERLKSFGGLQAFGTGCPSHSETGVAACYSIENHEFRRSGTWPRLGTPSCRTQARWSERSRSRGH